MNSATTSLLAEEEEELGVLSFGNKKDVGSVQAVTLKVEGE